MPPPVGGWNTRDSLSTMPPEDAYILENWIPDIGDIRLRSGFSSYATNVGSGNVDTLVEYHVGSTRKLIACANNHLYDVTAGGDASGNFLDSSGNTITNNQWSTTAFNGRLFFVNGTDVALDYDGTTVNNTAWTGVTTSNLSVVMAHKGRMYFIEENTASFWYGGAGSVTGALTEFDLSATSLTFGGNLVAMGSWTIDGGAGPDDYAAFITSTGEVIIYQGDDPGTAANWSLVGVYSIGIPIGDRCVEKIGGDLIITTTTDYVRMSEVLRTGQLGQASKLSGAIREAAANASVFGWQTIVWRGGDLIIGNVPNASGVHVQHVVNTKTGAACKFTGIDSRCWGEYSGELYFGSSNGTVYKYTGNNDDGANIEAVARTAWADLGVPTRKRVTASRPIITTDGAIEYNFSAGFDFVEKSPLPLTVSVLSGSLWDAGDWDETSWGGDVVKAGWRVTGGWGQYTSTVLQVASQSSVSWQRTDYRFEQGKNL